MKILLCFISIGFLSLNAEGYIEYQTKYSNIFEKIKVENNIPILPNPKYKYENNSNVINTKQLNLNVNKFNGGK